MIRRPPRSPLFPSTTLVRSMAEWSFAPADLRRVIKACTAYFKANRWPNLPIEIELTKTDNHLMSPWNWEGLDYIVKLDRKSTRLNSSHANISYAVFCLKKKK